MIQNDSGREEFSLAAEIASLKQVFRPSSPIDDRELFKGRTVELTRVTSAVHELGQHVVMYGERGVGKTSLAYMARDVFRSTARDHNLAVRIPCSADDNFATVWKKLVPRLTAEVDLLPQDVAEHVTPLIDKAEDILDFDQVSPESASRALHVVSSRVPLLVVLDEFDRIGDLGSTQLFADLIKTLSDDLIPVTILVVGVADDVEGLIQGHRSIERAIRQIAMPRMQPAELRAIVEDGYRTFERRSGRTLAVTAEIVNSIVGLSEGFPYFTHLLAGSVGEVALLRGLDRVEPDLLPGALRQALDEAAHSIRTSYTEAVVSPRKDAQFATTLLACALAEVDELGFFAPADVRQPLSRLTGTWRDTPFFLNHLKRFADHPSWVLETRGDGRRARYRFSNPLMRPFVLIKGVRDGLLEISANGARPSAS
jgi:Cdc6-like AAA superfamily ATPase